MQNAARVKAAIKLTQEDSQTIAILRKEVEKAWKLVEQAKTNEEKARKIISDLKNEISHLSKIVDKGSGLNVGEDNSVTKMMEEKAKLENEVAQKNDIIGQLEVQQSNLNSKIMRMENELLKEKDEIEKLKHDNEKLKDDKSREERKNKYAEEEKKNLQSNMQEKDSAIDSLRQQSDKLSLELKQKLQELKEVAETLDTKTQQLQTAKLLKQTFDNSEDQNKRLSKEVGDLQDNLRERMNENKMIEKRNKELTLLNTQLANEKDRMAREKMEAVGEKNMTKSGVSALTREIEYLRKQVEQEKVNIVNLIRERDMMKKSILKELIMQNNEYKKLLDDMEHNKVTL